MEQLIEYINSTYGDTQNLKDELTDVAFHLSQTYEEGADNRFKSNMAVIENTIYLISMIGEK